MHGSLYQLPYGLGQAGRCVFKDEVLGPHHLLILKSVEHGVPQSPVLFL